VGGMARLPEHRFSEETKLKCKERARFTCEYCGAKDVPLEIHHRIAIHFAQEIPCLAPAVISSLQNSLCLCHRCHIKEFHNPKEETNESYIAIAAIVLQEYLKAMIDPHQDDWRDDLVQAYNGNYYKKKRKRRRRK